MPNRLVNRWTAALVAPLVLVAGACGGSDGAADESAVPVDGSSDWAAYPSGPLCAAVPAAGDGSFEGMSDDPAAIATANNPELASLAAAVDVAGLVDTLNGTGPFTIFAPVNEAFAAVPDLDALLADQDGLRDVLTFHVVAGERLSSADLSERDSVDTVQGTTLSLATENGVLRVNGHADVGCADVHTANATVHFIDAVLLPAGG
ncbi:MAG: fasciclin domain-containing protein [Ilumatobacteraceae bacterium]